MMKNNQKRKHIFWSSSAEIPDKKLLPSQKRRKQKIILSPGDLKFAKELDTHLRLLLIDLIIYKLECLKRQFKLFIFMKHLDYSLFEWALEHKNSLLIDYLLNNLSGKQCFIMLSYANHAAFKRFIISILEDTNAHIPIEANIITILKAIFKIEPVWQTKEAIEGCFIDKSQLSDSAIVKELRLLLNSQPFIAINEIDGGSAESSPAEKNNDSASVHLEAEKNIGFRLHP